MFEIKELLLLLLGMRGMYAQQQWLKLNASPVPTMARTSSCRDDLVETQT